MSETRWSRDRANEWYAAQPWLVGCNFIPSTAINQLEMWQGPTFDPKTIGRELGWAADLGCVVLPSLQDCLAACPGCGPEGEVCGADGQWHCPCALACHDVDPAGEQTLCCEPGPPVCVEWCEGHTAFHCGECLIDAHGCEVHTYWTEDCGGGACEMQVGGGLFAVCTPDPTACAAQDATAGADPCGEVLGFKFDGTECVIVANGCPCEGADCGALFADEATCAAAYWECMTWGALCGDTQGTWYADSAYCDCGDGSGWKSDKGCYSAEQEQCETTGGAWTAQECGPYCGTCTCPEGSSIEVGGGCS